MKSLIAVIVFGGALYFGMLRQMAWFITRDLPEYERQIKLGEPVDESEQAYRQFLNRKDIDDLFLELQSPALSDNETQFLETEVAKFEQILSQSDR